MQNADDLRPPPPGATDAPGGGALDAWLHGVWVDAVHLVSVPRLLWLAVLFLSVARFAAALTYTRGGHKQRERWKSLKVTVGEGRRMLFLLFGFTVLGNMAPLFGWVVFASWAAAGGYLVKQITATATAPESDLRAAFADVSAAIARRNLLSMRAGSAAAGALAAPPAEAEPDTEAGATPDDTEPPGGSIMFDAPPPSPDAADGDAPA